MALRIVNTTMLRRINELENTFKVWRPVHGVDAIKLRRLADEIQIVQGIFSNILE